MVMTDRVINSEPPPRVTNRLLTTRIYPHQPASTLVAPGAVNLRCGHFTAAIPYRRSGSRPPRVWPALPLVSQLQLPPCQRQVNVVLLLLGSSGLFWTSSGQVGPVGPCSILSDFNAHLGIYLFWKAPSLTYIYLT